MRKKINFIRSLISRAKLQRKLWNNRSYETYAKTNLNVKSVNLVRLPKAASLFFKVWLLNMASAMFSYRYFREKGPWFESYLSSRYRKTIFWQSSSSSRKGSQVVPQNSILWTSPSTIYIHEWSSQRHWEWHCYLVCWWYSPTLSFSFWMAHCANWRPSQTITVAVWAKTDIKYFKI